MKPYRTGVADEYDIWKFEENVNLKYIKWNGGTNLKL